MIMTRKQLLMPLAHAVWWILAAITVCTIGGGLLLLLFIPPWYIGVPTFIITGYIGACLIMADMDWPWNN